jgi:hypothetical protein
MSVTETSPPDQRPNDASPHPTEPIRVRRKHWIDYVTFGFELLGLFVLCVYAAYTIKIYRATKQSADAATNAAKTAADSLVLAQRPWIKIKHRIVQPLTFNVSRWKGPVATMTVEDTLENVGQSVALNVFSWEDIIPVGSQGDYTAARVRQAQWCDANRGRIQTLSGDVLFPKDPFVQQSSIGPFMDAVNKAADSSLGDLRGKVAFVLVGCIAYRSSFEPPTAPAHETRFMYYLGEPSPDGGFQPYVTPTGVAKNLRLIMMSDGLSAD